AQTQAALSEHQGALAASEEARRRLEVILGELRREKFGTKSEKLRPDQYHLPLEDVEIAQGILDAAQERAEAVIKGRSRSEQWRQMYFGRRVTNTRHCAGITSSRLLTSSPIFVMAPQPHGQSAQACVHTVAAKRLLMVVT
ncbi:hypothetical protein ABIC09_007538, partial [Bradyrhizobium sp. S3.12.5]